MLKSFATSIRRNNFTLQKKNVFFTSSKSWTIN